MKTSKPLQKIRITLDLTPEFYGRLEELQTRVGKTKSGVIREALQLYEHVAQKTLDGYSFQAVDKKGKSEGIAFFSVGN